MRAVVMGKGGLLYSRSKVAHRPPELTGGIVTFDSVASSEASASGLAAGLKAKGGSPMVMSKCIICDKRPATQPHYRCVNCAAKIEAETKGRKPAQPVKFIVYRDNVVGLYKNGGDTLKPRLLNRKVDSLPKLRTINLDEYCEGYIREQVKRFKAIVLRLSDPMIGVKMIRVK